MSKIWYARRFGARLNQFHSVQSVTTRLATEQEEREAKEGESARREAAKAWSCNHCYDHLGVGKTESLPVVKKHLKDA